jgi:hypothetical protein
MAGVSETGGTGKLIINSTYGIMASSKAIGSLKPGAYYRFTYNTKYRQLVTNTILTGAAEQLIILATSSNTFADNAYSINFPTDEITFNFNDNLCEDGVTARTGFITKRKDTVLSNEAPYDFRTILFRRWAIDTASIPDFQTLHAYVVNDVMKTGNVIYECRLAYNSTAAFFNDFDKGYWTPVLTYSETIYQSPISTTWSISNANIPVLAGTFEDLKTFTSICDNVVLEYYDSAGDKTRFGHNAVLDGVANVNSGIFISGTSTQVTFNTGNHYQIIIRGAVTNSVFANNQNNLTFDSSAIYSNSSFNNNSACAFVNASDSSSYFINRQCLLGRGQFQVAYSNTAITVNNNSGSFIKDSIDCILYSITSNVIVSVRNLPISNVSLSYIRKTVGGAMENLSTVTVTPPGASINQSVYIYSTQNKNFTGLYNNFTFRSKDTAVVTYATNYSNVKAENTSPNAKIWYSIVDNTGTVSYDFIQ